MTAETLLTDLEARGAYLTVVGDVIRIEAPPGTISPELLRELRTHKPELIDLLTWPAECLEVEREHGRPTARLYPLIGQTVNTPMGPGRLAAALPERAVVLVGRRSEAAVFLPGEVAPLHTSPQDHIRTRVH